MWKMQKIETPYNPWETAFLSEPIPRELNRDFSEAVVSVTPEGPNIIRGSVESRGESFVVFSEHYIPGWHCKIDGKKVPIYRTNAVLMGIKVPPGNHEIRLYYLPKHFLWGAGISGITLIGLLVMLFTPLRSPFRKIS